MPPRQLLHLVLDRARQWPVESQLQARRNAMVAATALTQRRAEHDEVEAYLAALHGQHRERTAPTSAAAERGHLRHG
ncbi:hypothetical protein [Nocardioides sp. SYSU DS0663]|uniref:hypothetical protein n=1 Tax=Nocardioides sp. SYSU DS0663 TaxID=3416445 RepID=UPI003F4C32C6